MENKFINRYNTFCKSLSNLEKSRYVEAEADFVLAATVQNFNLTFDICWKVMKDILVKHFEIVDFGLGSPRETLQRAFTVGMIDDDKWLRMLKIRNQLAHDYDGELALRIFNEIIHDFYELFLKFKEKAEVYFINGLKNTDTFGAFKE